MACYRRPRYGEVWAKARKEVLSEAETTSLLARRPYDLRHAGVSFWLSSGVDAMECARRAGHSVAVLHKVYARCLTRHGSVRTVGSTQPFGSGTSRSDQALPGGHLGDTH